MRPILTPAVLAIVALGGLAGCSTPCQDLGAKLCTCRGAGTDRAACEQSVKQELSQLHPKQDDQDACEAALKTCKEPDGIDLCAWLDGEDGKIACGLALPPAP
jgi:uncharacterized protein YgiB involved in biofilm formation